jgi:hypothetical protein
MWIHFRRLLLGTVIEALSSEGIQVDLPTLKLAFDDDLSAFRFPAMNNYMRFAGFARVGILAPIDRLDRLQTLLRGVWPDIIASVHFPLLGRLEVTQNQVTARVQDNVLHIAFDLIAD